MGTREWGGYMNGGRSFRRDAARRNSGPFASRLRFLRCPHRRHDDTGFTLIEVIVGMVILVLVLVGIGTQIVVDRSSLGSSRDDLEAGAIVTKVLNEARALPYTDIRSGLSNADTIFTATTTCIHHAGTATYVFANATPSCHGNGQAILHSNWESTPIPAPLSPHRPTSTTVNGVTFTVRTFPTTYATRGTVVTGVYQVTVVVSWTPPGVSSQSTLAGETLISSSGTTCVGSTTDPYAAPCTPNFAASASAGGGSISVSAALGATSSTVQLLLPASTATANIRRSSTVNGWAQTGGISITPTGLSDVSRVTSAASDDPGSPLSSAAHSALLPAGLTVPASTSLVSLSAKASASDAGSSSSTVSANSSESPPCTGPTGAAQVNGLACGHDAVTQGGSATIDLQLLDGVGSAPLVTVAATTTHADVASVRQVKKGATNCPTTRTNGCVEATAQDGVGTISLGGLPTGILNDVTGGLLNGLGLGGLLNGVPAKWGGGSGEPNALLTISNLAPQATVWAKGGTTVGHITASPSAGTAVPKLTYWDGTEYTTVTLNGSTRTVPVPHIHIGIPALLLPLLSGALTVTLTATVTVGSALSKTSDTAAVCVAACTGSAAVTSLISGSISLNIAVADKTVCSLKIAFNLGTTAASASYQAAS
jgi:prepilin-type N-terminal cleavage/methylation domain-containing protein